ncbi:hypothetical protein N7516_003793 [Penicillium verrucosum]|uniref:uncharacterized protein n=1 Tax=Penicillium verrucosum TaxID=60171 RepID=UPI002545B296|nr:uncharacterized protein N7516_003793 [Penicillium verrucosum]KAJ5943625.1 hypothetical protein N7516_003793 [Penicillium verrucosum]
MLIPTGSPSLNFRLNKAGNKMASGLFFDPLKLLRVAPLLTTTSALLYAWGEHWYLSGFLRSQHKSETETILPSYFRRFFEQGIFGIFIVAGLNILTLSSSVANLLIDRPVLDRLQSSRWYWVGLVFIIFRLLSVPLITYPIRDIIENRSQGESTKDLQHRIDMHRIRVFCYWFAGMDEFPGRRAFHNSPMS